ncbi:MAG: hypothetical protein V1815_02890 [Candidatus Woesearchaeota archaeon]
MSEKSTYPTWEEVFLFPKEEKEVEDFAKKENIRLMKECIRDSKKLFGEENLQFYQSDVVNVAIALFEKESSHVVYHKENKARDKFDSTK